MKRFFIPILTLLLAFACTPDNGGNDGGGNNNGEYTPTGKITVKGTVYGSDGPLKDVVVSDGLLCVKSNESGYFEIDSDLKTAKFIMVSTPSGYTAPLDSTTQLPIFYHEITAEERKSDNCIVKFNLLKITDSDPNRYTMIIGADPQPRSSGATWDKIAYHSLEICKDFYLDMREKASNITDRKVYGLMLGDIVHENMNLFQNYIDDGLKSLGFPMFNVLGNHDNDKSAANDVEGRRKFEEKFGPTYYSFNIGKQHYIVLDNLIMKKEGGYLTAYDQGLTDEIWQWLQNDLRYVDRETTLMVAAHSPMFMLTDMSDRSQSGGTKHGKDYATLLAKYAKVHAWAGHTHTTFNYNYPEDHRFKSIEVHTVARSTGELWTNEYLANGTPRGYTIVEVDGDEIEWQFKPTAYQTAKFTGATKKQPTFPHREYTFNEQGVAMLNGKKLSDSYQMQVYKPNVYTPSYNDLLEGKGDKAKYIYVDVFMWDDKWEKPKYNNGTRTITMSKVSPTEAYSLANYELKNHYFTYWPISNSDPSGYFNKKETKSQYHTLFRAYDDRSKGSGTITVTDRFGNEYTSKVSW